MKNFLGLLCATLMFVSCQTESVEEEFDLTDVIDLKMERSSVCHYSEDENSYHVIDINSNALDAHLKHGDVLLLDDDNDGFVTNENMCGVPVDCDDADSNTTEDCFFNSLSGCYAGLITANDFSSENSRFIERTQNAYLYLDDDNYIGIQANPNGLYRCFYDIDSSGYIATLITAEEYNAYRAEILSIMEELNL